MKRTTLSRVALIAVALGTALPALADTQFRVRRMTRDDIPLGKGQCDIRLQVDNEVEVYVRGDQVRIRTIEGRDAYDDGNSECNAPLPNGDIENFDFEVRDRRNDIQLIAEPARRNNYSAVVRIRDTSGGQGRYHFRLTWQMTGSNYRNGGPGGQGGGFDDRRPPFNDRPGGGFDDRGGPQGYGWNGSINFRGEGRGVANFSGPGPNEDRRLRNANVNIDRNGRVVVSFVAEGGLLAFNGYVNGREGRRIRADVTSRNGRIRGQMWFSVDDRERVNAITLEASGGRERLRLTWDRR